jgi:hypothetical protein
VVQYLQVYEKAQSRARHSGDTSGRKQ